MLDLSKIPVFYNRGIAEASLKKILENFDNDKTEIKKSIIEEIGTFQKKQTEELEQWQREKETYKQKLEALETENKELSKKIAEQTQIIDNEKTRLSTVSSSFQTNYDKKMLEFKEMFEEQQKQNEEIFNTAQQERKDNFNDFQEKMQTDTNDLFQEMIKKRDAVEELWGIIGKSSVSGSSQSYANKAKNFAHFMTGLALLIMGGAIWSMFEVVKDFIQIKMDTKNVVIDNTFLVIRFVFNIVMFLPAWYCANIANKQRNREFQLRDFEIKTAGLEPFMENMRMVACDKNLNEPNKKDETKLELVKDIFQNDLNRKKVDDENIIITKDMLNVIKSCLDTISKLKKK